MSNNKKHLPLFGVGPLIVFGQGGITAIAIWLTYVFDVGFARFDMLKIPFWVVGILLILSGVGLDLSAKYQSKLFTNIQENKLITDGVYAYTRNPVCFGGLLICTGAIFIANNLLLFGVPVICWIYMTIFLIKTEEVWLKVPKAFIRGKPCHEFGLAKYVCYCGGRYEWWFLSGNTEKMI